MNYDFNKTIGGQIHARALAAFPHCFAVHNDAIPEHCRDGVSADNHALLADVMRKHDRHLTESEPSEHEQLKAIRMANVEQYCQDVATTGEIDYNVNEDAQYRNELAFCAMGLKEGIFTEDDFSDDE